MSTKKQSIPHALIGAAGVHYVASELSRRGIVALPTIRNTAAFDIIAASADGKKHANIQVKTSLRRAATFWLMPRSAKVCCGCRDFYVLVRWKQGKNGKQDNFETFMLSGKDAKAAVTDSEKFQRKRIKLGKRNRLVPVINLSRRTAKERLKWANNWLNWTL